MSSVSGAIMDHFANLPDPRIDRAKRHSLMDVLTISLCAVICGADSFTDMETFGQAKYEWFVTFLELPNGIPSHDTFARIFSRIDPQGFSECFLAWISAIQEKTDGVIAFDGKTLRRSFDKASCQSALHMVSAWASQNSMVLGQIAVDEKSNEITAIPQLLKVLDLAGCIVTIDAMGTQKSIACQIIEREADYELALKENHPNLYADVRSYMGRCITESWRDAQDQPIIHTVSRTRDAEHGRIETRRCFATKCPDWMDGKAEWAGLQSIVVIESERHVNGKTSFERRYYITSLMPNAKQIAQAVRKHWGIENKVHWVLDMAFREDECRIRKDNAPINMATLRHIALNLLKQENSGKKKSIHTKRLLAGWEHDYLLQIITGKKN
jgi:predicted transposase YbfD/YdcC